MELTDYITHRFGAHLTEIGADFGAVDEADWPSFDPDPSDTRRRLGFAAPRPSPGLGWYAEFCPALLARSMGQLRVDQLDDALAAIEWIIDTETAHIADGNLTTAERIRETDNALADLAGGSLRLLSEMELALLDGVAHG